MKRINSKRILIAPAFVLALALGVMVALGSNVGLPSAHAQNDDNLCLGHCSVATIKGCYAIELSGWQGAGPGRVPFGLVGFFTADGNGNISGVGTISVDGVITPNVQVTATYTVDPETCTVTASSNLGTFIGAIADGGKEVRAISTTAGLTVTGVSRRQFGS